MIAQLSRRRVPNRFGGERHYASALFQDAPSGKQDFIFPRGAFLGEAVPVGGA
jgi:hypothetical protein